MLTWHPHADVARFQERADKGQARHSIFGGSQSGASSVRVLWHHLRLGSHLHTTCGMDGQDESFRSAFGSVSHQSTTIGIEVFQMFFFLYIYERRLWNTPFFMCMMVFSSISACIHDMLLYLIFTTHGLQVRISPSTMCCQTLGVLASQNLGILSPTHKDP